MRPYKSVRIDGEIVDPSVASIPVTDVGFTRGYGCFEVIRAIGGRCFRLGPHLDRLETSAEKLGIELPDRGMIDGWAAHAAAMHDGGVVRIFVSAGDDPFDGDARIVVTSEPLTVAVREITLLPVVAPWHSDGESWELAGAKTLSYANNVGASRAAKLEGFTDGLLVGRSGRLLEGPTFTAGWVVEDAGRTVYETPAISLGILVSITRQLAFDSADDAGLELREVECTLDRLADATEFFALSTLRDTDSVTAVGDRQFSVGPATAALRHAIQRRIATEMGTN